MADKKKRLTLRDLNDEIAAIIFDTPYHEAADAEVEAQLQALDMDFYQQLEELGLARVEQKAYVSRLKAEKKRIDSVIKNVEARGKWLDLYCMGEMIRKGIRAFKGNLLRLSIRMSPVSAELPMNPDTNQPKIETIDPRFVEQIVTYKVDKSAAIQHFKNTGEIPKGIRIIETLEHLRIG